VEDEKDRLRRALQEIEELITEADREGGRVDHWLEELADELRAALPAIHPGDHPSVSPVHRSAGVASSMRLDPARSIGAHGRVDPQVIKLLKD
jgi:hypothetical protein